MKKKVLKITGIILLLFVVLLIAAPFFLKGKIAAIIKNKVNNSINADFDFAEADLSLFRNFPKATVSLEDIAIINNAPFAGDTLFASKEVELSMSIKELFKKADDPIAIDKFKINGALVHIIVDKEGNANYDIGKETSAETNTASEADSNFKLSMQSYEILDTEIRYYDRSSGMFLDILNMNHSGTGDLSLETSELDTKTSALVSFEIDSTKYLNENKIKLDALIAVDLKENKYSFLKNEAIINQLPLVFDGFVKVNEENQEVAVNFKTPSSDFKNFLAVIPEVYSKNIEDVTTTGNFILAGNFNGIVDDTHIPKFDIKINSNNASFKYPDLPKAVRNVFIDTEIINKTGIAEDTEVAIRKLSFMIDEDKFNMSSNIKDLMGNPKVKAHLDGKINLENIPKAYPAPKDLNLKGKLEADVTTSFDMASIEKHQYENTNTTGNLNLNGFEYKSEEIPNVVKLHKTTVTFNPKTVTLNELDGATGKTDFNAKGTIDNLLGFMFNDEKVEGNFNLKSDTFAVDDFMVAERTVSEGENETPTTEEKIKIPSFLDCTIKATANKVLYDNLILENVSGDLKIKDEKAILSNMSSDMFDGKLAFSGQVSTKNETPTFAMKLGMDKFKISETFKSLEMLSVLAPIVGVLKGKLTSDIVIAGNLNDDFTPDLKSISGKVLAEVLETEIKPEQTQLLAGLTSKLNFLNTKNLNLKGLKTVLLFEDGLVKVKPFKVNYKDIAVNVDGSHTFDQKLNYKATLDVPAKYLGTEVTSLIAKINDSSLEGLTIPVTANIGGNYKTPEVKTDLTSGVKSLTTKLIDIQKQKLVNKGKEKATELIGGLLGGDKKEKDTTATKNNTEEAVKDVLGGFLGGKKKEELSTENEMPQDTTATKPEPKKDELKEAATNILGGLLGGKKKKKDSVE